MARPGKNRIPAPEWVKKVDKLFLDAANGLEEAQGYTLGCYNGLDEHGNPIFDNAKTEEVLENARNGAFGSYVILDKGGDICGECAIGLSGQRVGSGAFNQERTQLQLVGGLSDGWERLAQSHAREKERLEKKIEKLEEKLELKQNVVVELQKELFEATQGDDSDETVKEIAKRAMGFFEAHTMQKRFVKLLGSPQIFGQLSPQAQSEIMRVINGGGFQEAVEALEASGEDVTETPGVQ